MRIRKEERTYVVLSALAMAFVMVLSVTAGGFAAEVT